jgi:hypothetical protein
LEIAKEARRDCHVNIQAAIDKLSKTLEQKFLETDVKIKTASTGHGAPAGRGAGGAGGAGN